MLVSCGPRRRHGRGVVGTVRSWNVVDNGILDESGEVIVCEETFSVRCARLVKNGTVVLSCGDDGRLVWSTTDSRARCIASTSESAGGLLSCDTEYRLALSCGLNQGMRVWDAKKQKIIRNFGGPASACCFGASALCCAVAPLQGDSMIQLYAVKADKQLCALGERTNISISKLEFSPTRPNILCALHIDGTIRAWDASRSAIYATIMPPLTSMNHHHKASGLAFSPVNQKFFASTASDGALLFSDLDAAKHVMSLPDQDAAAVTFLTERIIALATYTNGEIKTYDLRNTSAGPLFTKKAHDGPVATLHFVTNGKGKESLPLYATHTPTSDTIEPSIATTEIPPRSPNRIMSPSHSENGQASTEASIAHASPSLNTNISPVPNTPPSSRREPYDITIESQTPKQTSNNIPSPIPNTTKEGQNAAPSLQNESQFGTVDLQATIREAVRDATEEIRLDIQNLHLDIIRQFQVQQNEISALIADHSTRLSDIVSDNDALRAENRRLQQFIETQFTIVTTSHNAHSKILL